MIIVIADDLSGAAELANAAVAAGFSAEVQRCATAPPVFPSGSASEVICLDSDSRSLTPESWRKVGQIALHVAAIRPALVYKKCDSVFLRGPIAA